MAESNSFNLFCLHEKVPEKVSKKMSLIKTEVLTFTKFVDEKTPQKTCKCVLEMFIYSHSDIQDRCAES